MNASEKSRYTHYGLAERVRSIPAVIAVDVLEASGGTKTEIVIQPGVDGCPPEVLSVLADNSFSILSARPRGEPAHWLVEAI